MAATFQINPFSFGHLLAASDLSTKRGYFVNVNSSGTIELADAGNTSVGILGNKPTSGQPAEVIYAGVVECVAGAAVTVGDHVKIDASGKATPASTGQKNMGRALSTASGDGVSFDLLLLPNVME